MIHYEWRRVSVTFRSGTLAVIMSGGPDSLKERKLGANRKKVEEVIIKVSAVAAGMGAVLLIVGEATLLMHVFILGLAISIVSVVIYYCSGEERRRLEDRYFSLPFLARFLVMFACCLPWVFLYILSTPFWGAVTMLFGSVLLSLAIARFWKKGEKRSRDFKAEMRAD